MRHFKFFSVLLASLFLIVLPSCMEDPEDAIVLPEDQLELIDSRSDLPISFKARYSALLSVLKEHKSMTILLNGKGHNSYLGASEWKSKSRIDITGKENWRQTGTMTFTTSDGDFLYGYYMGIANQNSTQWLSGSGHYVITHGTGKYRTVSGEGDYEYAFSNRRSGYVSFEGIIDCEMTVPEETPVQIGNSK